MLKVRLLSGIQCLGEWVDLKDGGSGRFTGALDAAECQEALLWRDALTEVP